jgi:GxxExxY protein
MRCYTDPNYKHSTLTSRIIKACFTVYNKLGAGFAEKVYENALVLELRDLGLEVRQQYPIKVYYNGNVIGDYTADLIVENTVIVEIKAVVKLNEMHEVQLVNYLKATDADIGLLVNFGSTITIKRKIFDQ